MRPVRTAILLAAGRGTRLAAAVGGEGPKTLVPIQGRTLLERHTAALAAVGVEHIVLVVGHAAARVRTAAEGLAPRYGVRFSFVENPDYAQTNTVVSQYLARAHLADGCFCLNGDVLFGEGVLRRLLDADAPAALAIDVKRCGDEEVKAVVCGDRVIRLGKRIDPELALGEFIGVARYDAEAGRRFAEALAHAVERQHSRTDYFEVALDAIAGTCPLRAVPTDDEPVIEIDTPDDLRRALVEVAPRLAWCA